MCWMNLQLAHQRDNDRFETLIHLRNLGNIPDRRWAWRRCYPCRWSCYWYWPGAGVHGGEIVAQGLLKITQPEFINGKFLSGERRIAIPEQRTCWSRKKCWLSLAQNLKNVNLKLPVGLFTCITGVSGSGEVNAINDTLFPIATPIKWGYK